MATFLVYLYKKKPLRPSRGPYTSVHLNTKFHAQILCSDSVLPVLSLPSSPFFSPFFTGRYYSLCTAHWVRLLIHFYRTGLDYSYIFTVLGYLIHIFLPWWVILFIYFYRGGLSYSYIFTVVAYITHTFLP